MKLTFLGTGTSQGVPVITCDCEVCTSADPRDNRLRTSAMVEMEGKTFVFDTGPDFRQQMLREKVGKLDAVLFTHAHKDHIAGMDDVRSFNFRWRKPMEVYATDPTIEALKREYHYIFNGENYPGIPRINIHEIDANPFEIEDVAITPLPVLHYRMPVLGFRIGKLAYITDANFIPDSTKALLEGLDVLVINALRKKKHISHFNLEEAIALHAELQPRQTYFTHISHLMGKHSEVSEELPANIEIAYDGLQVEI